MDNILMNVLCTEGQSIALIRYRRRLVTPSTGRRNAVLAGKQLTPGTARRAKTAREHCPTITAHMPPQQKKPIPTANIWAPTRLSLKPAFYTMWIANT